MILRSGSDVEHLERRLEESSLNQNQNKSKNVEFNVRHYTFSHHPLQKKI